MVSAAPTSSIVETAHRAEKQGTPKKRTIGVWLGLFGLALFATRLTGLPDFTGNEWRLAAYVLDAVQNGRWFGQTDTVGDIASKPPLLTWLVALTVLPTGRLSPVALYWPSACATIVTTWLLLQMGWSRFGWRAGFLSGVSYLASAVAFDQMRMARYDGLLALAVTLGAMAAWHGWQTGRGWTGFWTVAAVGTLVKGPLALVLSAAGLLASVWERRSGRAQPFRGTHWPGLAIYLVLTGGWFLLAYLQIGSPIIDKMLQRELVKHSLGVGAEGALPVLGAHEAVWSFLTRYAPWSALTLLAGWRVLARPAVRPDERRFERFVLLWLAAGLVIFSVAAHHRPRLIYPLIPPAALLAGRELSRWSARLGTERLLRVSLTFGVVLLIFTILYTHLLLGGSRRVQATLATRDLARTLQTLGPGEFPLTYLDRCGPLQIWRSTRRPTTPVDQVADLLRGEAAAFVVLDQSDSRLGEALAGQRVFEVFRWPARGKPRIRVVSNHPRLEWPERTAMMMDGLRVQMEGAHLLRAMGAELGFRAEAVRGTVLVTNESLIERTVRVRLTSLDAVDWFAEGHLAPRASWRTVWSRGPA